jgi:electron-transferring-flavoprotein dehydrogenase
VTERETLDLDILIVGGGPAGLAAAIRLAQLQQAQGGEPLAIAVLEKAREAGAHQLSGAVLDPSALRDLIPDFEAQGAPLAAPVRTDDIYYFTAKGKFRFPITPPPLRNHGNYVISLARLTKWMAERAEAAGIDIFTGFAASEVLYDGDRVIGVRTGDRGIDKHGNRKPTFEPGVDIHAKVTIFCDGVRGNLTKTLVEKLKLDVNRQPQVYALGIKELWEVPADRLKAGSVIHTLGHPLKMEEFGGAFIYAMPDGLVSVGFVSGLDYRDPMFDPHLAFQRFKLHPFVSDLLKDGKLIRYGAKALPEGGWHTVPRVHMAGALIAGDAGGFLNSMRLKGILYPVRNVHQAFGFGLLPGLVYSGLALVTRGWWFQDPMSSEAGHERMYTLEEYYPHIAVSPDLPFEPVKIDRKLTFDRLTNVHYSGTRHLEDQPSHLIVHDTDICRTRCRVEYGNPCTRFCPANVYEMVDDGEGKGGKRLQINASNCVHCKTCDIMDPYQIIDWVPPEGGEGPQYEGM